MRLFPHHIQGEGHFIAKLQSAASTTAPTPKKKHRKKKEKQNSTGRLDREQRALFDEFRAWLMPSYQPHHLIAFGDQLYDLPAGIDDLAGLTVLRPGLHLGTFKKNRFEPALAWALVVSPTGTQRVINIDHDQWRQYVHGDVITTNEDLKNGWYLLVCDQHPCGFGKLVGKTIKNFYPKGLRF